HPELIQTIQNQSERYLHVMVYGETIQDPQYQLAMAFSEHLPKQLNSTFFVNSGTEAIEGALKLAKRTTGKTKLISCKNSYHGSTHGALSLMGNESQKAKVRPLLPHCFQIEFNNIDSLEVIDGTTAAVVVEPVQGATGFLPATPEFLKALRTRCNEEGALLIFDEIQTCFGRLGTLFGFEYFDVVPDILCLAKGMGAGMPIGAFIASHDLMIQLSDKPKLGHINTFGGNALCCAVSLKAFDILKTTSILEEVPKKEKVFRTKLKHPKLKAIQGLGLALALEFESADYCQQVFEACLEKGLLLFFFLSEPNYLRISPPLTISTEDIERACAILVEVLDGLD
ncbi:MAG: aspartate aminotransferase family protein, partial [Flavobacteriales bacterium]